MVSIIIYYVLGTLCLVTLLPIGVWFFFWNKSFIHKVWIAKQSGRDISDVIWVEDKFKVVEKNGYHVVVLKWHKSKTVSPRGDLWTKFLKKTDITFTDDIWHKQNMKKMLGRGLYLYQNTEGEFHPISLQSGAHGPEFKVLTQDNRTMIVQALKDTQELTLSARKQLIAIVAVIGAIVILGILFFLFLIFLTEASAKICGETGRTITQTAQVAVGG